MPDTLSYCFYRTNIFEFCNMITDVKRKSPAELFNTPIVQQTTFWHNVKSELGVTSLAINYKVSLENNNPENNDWNVLDLLVIIQQISRDNTIAYVPYGPDFEPYDGVEGRFLEELSESLRSYLPANCVAIRYDLFWESFWAREDDFYDCNGWWIGPPETRIQELRFNFNTENWNLRKAYSNQLPSNTLFVNTTLDTNILLEQMKPKTRYNIRLSARKGVSVRALEMDQLDIWYKLYGETAARNGIFLHSIDYFRAILAAKENDENSPTEVILLIAEIETIPLAAMFLVISGYKGSYLYGASSSENRNYMGTYALQWEAIKIAKSRGCTCYDMFGVAPNPNPSHPMYGLYRFKSGFGGEMFHTLGCWDYPLNADKYNLLCSLEMQSQGYHI